MVSAALDELTIWSLLCGGNLVVQSLTSGIVLTLYPSILLRLVLPLLLEGGYSILFSFLVTNLSLITPLTGVSTMSIVLAKTIRSSGVAGVLWGRPTASGAQRPPKKEGPKTGYLNTNGPQKR